MASLPASPNRTLALLGGGAEQCIAVEIARELGYGTLVVDDDPGAPAAGLADRFLASRVKDAARLHSDLAGFEFHGVFTHAAELGIEQAGVAERFGLPSISVAAARRGTLKHLRIRAFAEAGIPVPAFREIDATADVASWLQAAEELGYPLVAKPTNEKGARGVQLVPDAAALVAYFDARETELDSPVFLLESFHPGLQISSETVLLEGRAAWHSFALRHYAGMERYHPYLIEDGHSMELALAPELRARLEALIDASAMALGVESGVLKGDLVVPVGGEPVVLEMAIRTSGGRFADLVTPLHCGVNILYPLIQLAMGAEVDRTSLEPRWQRGVSQRFLLLPEGARVEGLPALERHLAADDVEEIVLAPRFLESLYQGPIRSHHDRIGYVVCTGSDRDAADWRARELCRRLTAELLGRVEAEA